MNTLHDTRGASALGVLGYIIGVLILGFGLLVFLSLADPNARNVTGRVIIGLICAAVGGGLLFMIPRWESRRPQQIEMSQKIDLSGNINAQKLKCQNCGADLDKDSVAVRAGGIFVNCPYCKSAYQITEEPKW